MELHQISEKLNVPIETLQSLNIQVFTAEEREAFQKTIYDRGQSIGYKNGIKDFVKTTFGMEQEAVNQEFNTLDFQSTINKAKEYVNMYTQSEVKKIADGGSNEKIKEFEKQLTESQKAVNALQEMVKQKDTEITTVKYQAVIGKIESDLQSELSKANIYVGAEISQLGDDAVSKHKAKQIELLAAAFKMKYDIKIDANGNAKILTKNGDEVLNEMYKPLNFNEIVNKHISDYGYNIQVQPQPGNGQQTKQSNPNNVTKYQRYTSAKNSDALVAMITANGIDINSSEALDIFDVWRKQIK